MKILDLQVTLDCRSTTDRIASMVPLKSLNVKLQLLQIYITCRIFTNLIFVTSEVVLKFYPDESPSYMELNL